MSSSFNVGWLKHGLTSKRHATRGWLKKLLVQHNLLTDGNDAIWNRVMSDYQCQLVAMEVMRSIQGSDYKDPRLVTEHGVFKGKEDGRYQKTKTGIPTGVFTVPYLIYAYDVSETSFKRKRKELKEGNLCIPVAEHATHHRGTSVINNSQLCACHIAPYHAILMVGVQQVRLSIGLNYMRTIIYIAKILSLV